MTPITSITDRDFPMGAPTEIPFKADSGEQPPNIPPAQPPITFEQRKTQITRMISDWREEVERVEMRRKLRKNRKNVKEMRDKEQLLEDETVIADHTIDSNIASEKAAYMQYLETSRTLLTFTPRPLNSIPRELCTLLEESFTLGARYDRWKIPWYKIIDGTCLHGCIGFEIVFDETKPLHFAVDYIRREQFIYPKTLTELDKCDMFLRVYEYPVAQFEAWQRTDSGFDNRMLADIVERYKERRNDLVSIYKVYIKEDGVIKSGWYSELPTSGNTWLKEPSPHYIGMMEEVVESPDVAMVMAGIVPSDPVVSYRPVPCVDFPFVLFKYTETEDELVLEIPGRAAQDIYTQEAITSLLTSTVNGAKRASGLYVGNKPDPGSSPNNSTVTLEHGRVINGELSFFQPAWPNNIALSITQMLSTRNQQQQGRVDFAAMNRQDTAKTATELNAASTQAAMLGSVKVSLLADAIVRGYSMGWAVARSQALAGQIEIMAEFPPEILKHDYTLTPSGDVEVIKRQEKLMRMKEFFSVLANTPAAVPFLKYLIKQAFPEEAGELIAALDVGNKDAVITELALTLEKLKPQLPPNEQQQLDQIISAARSVVVGPANAGGVSAGGAPSNGSPNAGNESVAM